MIAQMISAEIFVDGRRAALLTIEHANTGTDELDDYLVTLDAYREGRTLRTEIKRFPRKQRLDLIAEAFRVAAELERT